MFRRLTLLLGIFWWCCGPLAIADDFELGTVTDNGITVDLNTVFGATSSCEKRPSGSTLFGATICVVTPGVKDNFFVEERPDLSIYNTNKAEDLLNQFKQEELERRYGKDGGKLKQEYEAKYGSGSIENLYDRNISTGVFRLNFRGLPIIASFPYSMGGDKDGRILAFSVPNLKINKIFIGKDREDSVEQLKNYFKKDGNTILTELTKISPDPITNSQKETGKNEFEIGTGFGGNKPLNDLGGDLQSLLGVGFRWEERTYNGQDYKYYSFPLSTRIPLGSGRELVLRLPLQYTEINGDAKVYQIIGGVSYKTPVAYTNNRWFLTPSFSYGMVGSEDVASVAQLVSTSLTSNFLLVERPNYSVSMGNLIGYSKTLPFQYKDWDLRAERANTITRNGILLSLPFSSLGMKLVSELFIIDTRAFGDPMYEDQFTEIGFSIGPKRGKIGTKKAGEQGFVNVSRQEFGLGFRYFHSDASNGFGFSVGYEF